MFFSIAKRSMILFVFFGLTSCIEIDGKRIFADKKDEGVISATIDGKAFEVESGSGIFSKEVVIAELEEGADFFLLTVYGVKVRSGGNALAFGFKLGGKNLEDVEINSDYTEWTLIEDSDINFEGAMGAVELRKSVKSEDHIYKASSNHTGIMSLIISEIDLEKRLISGVYNYVARDQNNGTEVEVQDGVFNSIEWSLK